MCGCGQPDKITINTFITLLFAKFTYSLHAGKVVISHIQHIMRTLTVWPLNACGPCTKRKCGPCPVSTLLTENTDRRYTNRQIKWQTKLFNLYYFSPPEIDDEVANQEAQPSLTNRPTLVHADVRIFWHSRTLFMLCWQKLPPLVNDWFICEIFWLLPTPFPFDAFNEGDPLELSVSYLV